MPQSILFPWPLYFLQFYIRFSITYAKVRPYKEFKMAKLILCLLTFLSHNLWAYELKILNWNTYQLPKYIKNSKQDVRAHLIAKYIRENAEQFDVITLQEVFTTSGRSILQQQLADLYPYQSGTPNRKWYKPVNSGLLILSKYPLSNQYFYMFRGLRTADLFSSKGILAVTITLTNGKKVHLATTHMQAEEHAKSVKVRESQYRYMKEVVIPHYQVDHNPFIITGDFNIDMYDEKEFSPFLEYMQFAVPIYTGLLQYTYDATINTLTSDQTTQQVLDYVFVVPNQNSHEITIKTNTILNPMGEFYYRNKNENSLSDHFPLHTVIEL
jgi:endonuclease/exonuclease/phosphatase family metal-dependent hydrolase